MKPAIAIIIEYGFHEIKKYIHSGFVFDLKKTHTIFWITIDKENTDFENYFAPHGTIISIPKNQLKISDNKIETQNNSIRKAYARNTEKSLFSNYDTAVNKFKIKDLLIGNIFFRTHFEKKTLHFIRDFYDNIFVKEIFVRHNIKSILFTNYTSALVKNCIITAQKNNLKTFYIANSWKDIYVNNFFPFRDISSFFVWDLTMKNSFISQCRFLKDAKFIVSGNVALDNLSNYSPVKSKQDYASKYGFDPNAKIIYYTMMSPKLDINEIEIVNAIAKEVKKTFSKNEVIILLRRNPQHKSSDFVSFAFEDSVFLTEHFATFDEKSDLNIQNPEGEQEWLDLLQFAAVNMSVPSSVTLEFLKLEKPTINIGFGVHGKPIKSLLFFFESQFYKPLFLNPKVMQCTHLDQITDLIKNAFSLNRIEKSYQNATASSIILKSI